MTQGHGQCCGDRLWEGSGVGRIEEDKGGKAGDNCSRINKNKNDSYIESSME